MSGGRATDAVIGARIAQMRQASRLSVQALSSTAQISPSDLERYEAGSERPRPEELLRIASALQTTIADLMDLS